MSHIDRTTRFRVLEANGFRCRYCGKQGDGVTLEVDHVVPRSKGGADTRDNLVAACFDCNRGKRDMIGVLPPPDAHLIDPDLPEDWPTGAFFHYRHDEESAERERDRYPFVEAGDITYQGRVERIDGDVVWVRLFSFGDGHSDGSLRTLPIDGWARFSLYRSDRDMRYAYTMYGYLKGLWPYSEVEDFDRKDAWLGRR